MLKKTNQTDGMFTSIFEFESNILTILILLLLTAIWSAV